MDHARPKLVIRVKTAKRNPPPPPKTTHSYRWDRIFAALASLVLLVGVVAYGIHRLLQEETPPELVNVVANDPETHTASAPETTPERRETHEYAALERPLQKLPDKNKRITEVVDNPIRPLPAAPGTATPGLQPEGTDMKLSALRPKQPDAAPMLETDTDPHQVTQERHTLLAETGAAQTQTERKRSAPAIAIAKHSAPATDIAGTAGEASRNIEANKTLAVAPDHDDRKALFRLRGITLAAPSGSRFVLAKSVVNKEPVGDIEDIVPDARGVAAVYAFSEVVGMKDEVLHYHWFRNSKQVAKVRVGVWADRWRSYSSKIINDKMKGEWQVELRNEKGEILASADFVYW